MFAGTAFDDVAKLLFTPPDNFFGPFAIFNVG
jgi:hypothetical protein